MFSFFFFVYQVYTSQTCEPEELYLAISLTSAIHIGLCFHYVLLNYKLNLSMKYEALVVLCHKMYLPCEGWRKIYHVHQVS